MKKYKDSITRELYIDLQSSASGYLRAGIKMFYDLRTYSWVSIQPAVGNLGIAIELMLKALIVKKNPIFIFKGLPCELQALFVCPEALPKDFSWRPFDIDLRLSNKYDTKELNDCISLFGMFHPEYKQELSSHFQLLSRCRNTSVHFIMPSLQRYELERIAYLALRLATITESARVLSKDDTKFLSEFKAERIERVKKKIEEAREKAKRITSTGEALVGEDDWGSYLTECPVCKTDGILSGGTELGYDRADDEGDIPDERLDFFADSFTCEECGLKLDDSEELRLAGMELFYDRSEDLDAWHREYDTPDYGF